MGAVAAAGAFRERLPSRWRERLERSGAGERSREMLLLVLSLTVPLLVMIVLTSRAEDPFLARRSWWFWGVEPALAGICLGAVLPRLGAPRWLSAGLLAAMVVCLFPTRAVGVRLAAVRSHGYGGTDDRLRAVEALARFARADGPRLVGVRYDLAVPSFQLRPSYLFGVPVGKDYDTVLWNRYGIVNGLSQPGGFPARDFVLRELRTSDAWRDARVPPIALAGHERIWRSGDYELWRGSSSSVGSPGGAGGAHRGSPAP